MITSNQAETELRSRAAKRELGRRYILDFTKYTFKQYADENWHHHLITKYYQKAISGKIKRLMVFIPPRNGKTEMLERTASWAYGHNPDLKIIGCAYGATRASDTSKKIKQNIKEKAFSEIFTEFKGGGFFRGALDKQDNWEIAGGHRGAYLSAGVNGPITGFGGELLLVDDPIKSRKDADSVTFQVAAKDWYFGTLLNRQNDKDSTIIIINTRWHTKDLCGSILEMEGIRSYNGHSPQEGIPEWNEQEDGKWDVLCLPAEMDEEAFQWKHPEDPREVGEALWPQKFPVEFLDQFKLVKNDWFSLYQGRPRVQGGNRIDGRWFKKIDPENVPSGGKFVRFWDLAATEKEAIKNKVNNPDFTAGGLVQYVDGNVYIWNVTASQESQLKRDKAVLRTAKKDRHDFGINVLTAWEDVGGWGKDLTVTYKNLLKDYLRQPMKVSGKDFYIKLLENKAETGDVYLVKFRGWIQEKHDNLTFIDEAEMYPSTLYHDDRIDAVAKACFIASGGDIESLESPEVDQKPVQPKSTMDQVEEAVLKGLIPPKVDNLESILEAIADKYVDEGDSDNADLFLDEVDKLS